MIRKIFIIISIVICAFVWAQIESEIPQIRSTSRVKQSIIHGGRFADDVKITDDYVDHWNPKIDDEYPYQNQIAYCAFEGYYNDYPAIMIYKTTDGGRHWGPDAFAGIYNSNGISLILCDIAVTTDRVCISYVRNSSPYKICTYSVPKTGGNGDFYEFPQNNDHKPIASLSKKCYDNTLDIAFEYFYSGWDGCIVYYNSSDGGITWLNEYSFALGEEHYEPSIYRRPGTNDIYLVYVAYALNTLKLSRSSNGGASWDTQTIPNTDADHGWPIISVKSPSEIVILSNYSPSSLVFTWTTNGGSTWNKTFPPYTNMTECGRDICYKANKYRAAIETWNPNVIRYKTANHPDEFSSSWNSINDVASYVAFASLGYVSGHGALVCWWDNREGGIGKVFCDAENWEPGVEENNQQTGILPKLFSLNQNYPNPVNSNTVIEYTLTENSKVYLKVFDTSGKLVSILVNEVQKSGTHQLTWDIRDITRKQLPNGVYFYRLTAGDYTETRKMVVVR